MNIVKAIFSGGCTQITAAGALWQWDQGQILQIVGLDLPDAYQVEFSNQPVRGTAAPMIGGVGGVEIPDVYLTTGKPVYAFVVLHAGEDDRETEYKITIPVNARPQPTDVQPTPEQQSVIDQLIAALNAGVEKAEDAADEAEGAADDAAAQAQAAAQSASSSASYAGDAAAQAGLAAAAAAGAEAAQAAAELAQGSAEAFATAAGVAKAAAETAQGKAEDAQAAAEAAQAAAESAKAGALAAKAAAETAQEKAEDAQEAAEQAAQDAHVEYEQLAGQVTAQGQTITQHGQAIAQNTADIADLDTELTRQKSAIEALDALVDRKAGALIDTASGAIASFVPDSTIPDLLGVSVAVEPVQDLHGYESPWPAGGGKNIMPAPTTIKVNSSGLTVTDSNGKLTINGSAQSGDAIIVSIPETTISTGYIIALLNSFINATIYFLNGTTNVDYFSASFVNRVINASSMSTLYGKPFTAYRITFSAAQTLANATLGMMAVLDGADTTTFAPYSNECPISGWDSVEVERTGVNLLDPNIEHSSGYINNEGGITQLAGYAHTDGYIRVKPSIGYCFSGRLVDTSLRNSVAYYDQFYNFLSRYVPSTPDDAVFTTPSNCKYIRFNYSANLGLAGKQLEEGSTASDYRPFAGDRYTITLGDTVYGGTLTISEDGSVKALVDRVAVDMGDIDWIRQSNGSIAWFAKNMSVMAEPIKPSTSTSNFARVQYSTYAYSGFGYVAGLQDCKSISNGVVLYVRDDSCATAADFIAKNTGQQLVYELAEPIVIQLDPVTIATIAGQQNNVWANTGDVSVEYAADLKHYIDSKIAAAVAALS